jgi:excisionase family DNA binding protein
VWITWNKGIPVQRYSSIERIENRAFHVREAAAIYRLSRSTLYKLMAEGKLRTVKVGGRRLVPRDAIEALIACDAL